VQAEEIKSTLNKIIGENFQNLEKQIVIQVQETFRTPNRQTKNISPQHIILTTSGIQNKKRMFKTARKTPSHL
jgi:uncharacterized protein YccT (UPF0319 family)